MLCPVVIILTAAGELKDFLPKQFVAGGETISFCSSYSQGDSEGQSVASPQIFNDTLIEKQSKTSHRKGSDQSMISLDIS